MTARTIDVVALVREAAAEVGRQRDAGRYPPGLVERLEEESRRPVAVTTAPEELAHISSARPLLGHGPLGWVTVAAKRAVRRLLAWYVRPIADDQSRFNSAVLAEVRSLQRRVDDLAPDRTDASPVAHEPGSRTNRVPAAQQPPAAIHQLLPVLSPHDAIGDAVLRYQRALRSLGFQSEIYAGLFDRALRDHAHPATALERDLAPGDAVMYHLSIGSPLAGDFATLPGRKAIYYHNISPADSLDGLQPALAYRLRRGRADLDRLAPLADLSMAASAFSSAELAAAGATAVAVVPLPLSVARLSPRPAVGRAAPELLFVGRFMPHKGQDLVVRTLAALRATSHPDARLTLVGRVEVPEYVAGLRALAVRLDVAGAMTLVTEPVSDRRLGHLYARSSVFLCASRHEGFCVPIVEALAFSLPVLALAAGAVPETLGNAGLVVADEDPLLWAELTQRLLDDRELRDQLAGAARSRLDELDDGHLGARLGAALAIPGWVAARPS